MTELPNYFDAPADPRARNARLYSLHDILALAFCTLLCAGQTGADMEIFGYSKREFLQPILSETGKRHPRPMILSTGCWERWIPMPSSNSSWA